MDEKTPLLFDNRKQIELQVLQEEVTSDPEKTEDPLQTEKLFEQQTKSKFQKKSIIKYLWRVFLILGFIAIGTFKPISQKIFYTHYNFPYPFFLAFLETVLFVPVAVLVYIISIPLLPCFLKYGIYALETPKIEQSEHNDGDRNLDVAKLNILARWYSTRLPKKIRNWISSYVQFVLPVAVAFAAQFIFNAWATYEASIAIVAITKGSQPVITAVLGFLFFGHTLPWTIIVVLCFIMFGSCLDLFSSGIHQHASFLAILVPILSAFATVIRSLLAERAMKKFSPLSIMIFGSPVTILLCFFICVEQIEDAIKFYPWTFKFAFLLCCLALMETVLLLFALALIAFTSALSQSVASSVVRPLTAIMAILILHEAVTRYGVTGMVITFGSSVIYIFLKWKAGGSNKHSPK